MQKKNSKLGIIMVLYLLGIFMGAVDTGIVSPARIIIQNGLGVDDNTGIWMITIYTLAYAAVIPISGKLADKYGRKYVYIISVALFGAGSVICGLSSYTGSFTVLLLGRVIQALGGGGIIPIATAEFGTTFPEEKRGMALGLVGMVFGVANIIGSSIGSFILKIAGNSNWSWLFYVNIPICVFIVIGGLMAIENHKAGDVKKIDVLGTLVLVAMILSILYGLRNIDFFSFAESIRSKEVYPYLLAFAMLLPIFIIVEKKAEDPIMNLSYFTNPRIFIVLTMSVIVGVSMMGMVFIPQFAENALKIPSGTGGYYVAILGIFAGVGSPMSGKLIDKYGAKKVLMFGFLVTMAGALFIVLISTNANTLMTVVISLVLIGLGMGFTIGTPLNYMMLDNTRPEESNSALATLSLVRSIGTAVAPAIMVGFLSHAGLTVGDRMMNILPQPTSPVISQVDELKVMLADMKSDPDTADMLKDVSMPDFDYSGSMKLEIGSGSLPAELLDSLQSADVTNITDKVKEVAVYMFDKNTPGVISEIESGVDTGITNMQKGIDGISEGENGLKSGVSSINSAISKMEKGRAGLQTAIQQMETAMAAQDAAIAQMSAASGANTPGVMTLGTNSAQTSLAPSQDQSAAATESSDGQSAMQAQLAALTASRAELAQKLEATKAQKKGLDSSVLKLEVKKSEMLDSIAALGEEKAKLTNAQNKTKEIKVEVPKAFDKSKNDYLAKIDSMRTEIQNLFQSILNMGFKQMFMTVFAANMLGVLMLMFYKDKKRSIE
jgi:EmrB/QacA subfamily drug resistance transporter